MISVDTVEELREAVSNGGEVVALLVRRGNITHFVAVSPG